MNTRISAALLTLSTSLALPLLTQAPASAVTVRIGGNDFDVSVINRPYSGNEDLFQALPPGEMPWWGDPTGDLAADFAKQVYNQLGEGPSSGHGPVFAYLYSAGNTYGLSQSLTDPNSQMEEKIDANKSVNYAFATALPPSSVPGPLPLFGTAAAFGWSRRLRARLRGERPMGGTTRIIQRPGS
jgi:hypothetical protein